MQAKSNIREIREDYLVLTQQEFAKLMGVSRQTVYNWEMGIFDMDDEHWAKMQEILEKEEN